ncbi:GlxA family transcriptional regulator [Cupriavidus gilardii]|uniref:GlxA family transcriptional regulator n=1 Tax=Cupriavidus gilardii TaxID=82541 RepID=UPI001EE5FD29|nr:GlxA family transcriptional regulator [Cupriavidus gilardii]MCG5258747.1 GlxA family transcriptional regulator [Cupriavidus gilardii]MDF9429265.1 GlxA family transcriptional regulator [Cupriavidus gilardii]
MSVTTVAILMLEGVQALDVAGPVDVFAEANAFIGRKDRYETVLVGKTRKPLRASNGMQLMPDLSLGDEAPRFDIVLVAGGPGLPNAPADAAVSKWLRTAASRARLHGSVCTGAFVLGHAGLLDGRTVTTHWQNAAHLAERFRAATVEYDRIYLRDGKLVTSAGVTAGIDLALALVREDHGAKVALAVAKRLVVVAQRQGGQSQFSPYLAAAPSQADSPVARVQAYVMANIGARLTLDALAAEVGMSGRNLVRLFVADTGMTPHAFIERARIDIARNLLEGSALPLKSIAYKCGFVTVDRMRVLFQQRLGISPAQYRANFR